MTDAFQPTGRSRLRRLHERGHHDRQTVYAILDAGRLGHVGYTIDGQPYVTPTLYWREGDDLYWHGSSASRMLRTVQQGVPACLTVSFLDGWVLAHSGFHCSANYRAAMAFGRAAALTDEAAKLAALDAFVARMVPGHLARMRRPTAQELKATTVVHMAIKEASAKIRSGPPIDDEADYALDCWAGVVPLGTAIGTPEADPRLQPGIDLPDYVRDLAAPG